MSTLLPLPAWAIAKVDQKLALMESTLPLLPKAAAIVTALTEPPEDATPEQFKTWNRTCDCCETYVPPASTFYTGQLLYTHNGQRIHFSFGICEMCKVKTSGS